MSTDHAELQACQQKNPPASARTAVPLSVSNTCICALLQAGITGLGQLAEHTMPLYPAIAALVDKSLHLCTLM